MHKPILPYVGIQLLFEGMDRKDQTFDHLITEARISCPGPTLLKINLLGEDSRMVLLCL